MKKTITILSLFLCVLSVQAEDTDIPPAFFTNLGYGVTSSQVMEPTQWEQQEFNLVQKRVTRIKSVEEVKGEPGWHYRFTIISEHFASETAAKARQLRLLETPPKTTPPDKKAYPLRKAFRNSNTLYTVSTDVSLYFDTQLDTVLKALEDEILKDKRGMTIDSTLSSEVAPSDEK